MAVSPGNVTDKFIDGLKPHCKRDVEENAPLGWWTIPDQLFDKALLFEVSHTASTQYIPSGNLNSHLGGQER